MMRKSSKNITPTIGILIVSFVIGLLLLLIHEDIDMFFLCVGTGVSIAVLLCSIMQNKIHKDNIKLQLFEKRYQVYSTILETKTLLQRTNWGRYIIAHGNNVNYEILSLEDKLCQAAQLSALLFSEDISKIVHDINDRYHVVADKYKQTLVVASQVLSAEKDKAVLLQILEEYLMSSEKATDNIQFNQRLQTTFPLLFASIIEFTTECQNYLVKIENTQIFHFLEQEVVIRDVDK